MQGSVIFPVIIFLFTVADFCDSQQAELRKCRPLQPSPGMVLRCMSPQKAWSDCSRASSPGTVASYKCDYFYRPVRRNGAQHVLTCRPDGTWKNIGRFREFACEIDCGIPTWEHIPFIAGGAATTRFSWPWHTALFLANKDGFSYICGGSLITDRVVLTAAHCFPRDSLDSYRIVLGTLSSNWSLNIVSEETGADAQVFRIASKFIQPEYDEKLLRSDVALIFLDRPITPTITVLPVCFPYSNDFGKPARPQNAGTGEVVGFGRTEDGSISPDLRYAVLPILGTSECIQVGERSIGVSQFCAGSAKDGPYLCDGDSGGGIYFRGQQHSRYYVQGVTSGSSDRKCGSGISYFTNVLLFTEWISEVVDGIDLSTDEDEIDSLPPVTGKPLILVSKVYTTETSKISSTSPASQVDVNEQRSRALDTCELGCSYVKDERPKYSWKGRDTVRPDYFTGFPEEISRNCSLICIELDFVEFEPEVMLTSLENCTLLQSICFTNILLKPESFNKKIYLPNLREFKMVTQNSFYGYAYTYDKMFWYKKKWELEDVLNLGTDIEVDCKGSCSTEKSPFPIRFNQGQKVVKLYGPSCRGILANRAKSVEVKNLTVVGFDCRIDTSVIPKALETLDLTRVGVDSLRTLLRSLKDLRNLRVSLISVDLLYFDLPPRLRKLYLTGLSNPGIQLRLQAGINEVVLPELRELFWSSADGKAAILNHIQAGQLKMPSLRQIGIAGNSNHPLSLTYSLINRLLLLPNLEILGVFYYEFMAHSDANRDTNVYDASGLRDLGCEKVYDNQRSSDAGIVFQKENGIWNCSKIMDAGTFDKLFWYSFNFPT